MKKLKDIKTEMELLMATNGGNESSINAARKRLQFLSVCKNYLETKPTEDFLLQEKERIKKRISLLEEWFPAYKGISTDQRKWRAEYNKETGVGTLKTQLKTINFLLN
jgi:predicted nuclease with TOPRIM domain